MGLPALAAGLALLAQAAPPPALHPDGPPASDAPTLTLRAPTSDLPGERHGYAAPTCSGDVCQPRVAVPGQDPQFTVQGRRTELALKMLQRTHVAPVETVARLLAVSGLRVEYSPVRVGPARGLERNGWGSVLLGVRWRLDAANRPVWATPPPR